jgi:hypothetical protein
MILYTGSMEDSHDLIQFFRRERAKGRRFKSFPRNQNSPLINSFQEKQKETQKSLAPNFSNCRRFQASCAASRSLQFPRCRQRDTALSIRADALIFRMFSRSGRMDLRPRSANNAHSGQHRKVATVGAKIQRPLAGCFMLFSRGPLSRRQLAGAQPVISEPPWAP